MPAPASSGAESRSSQMFGWIQRVAAGNSAGPHPATCGFLLRWHYFRSAPSLKKRSASCMQDCPAFILCFLPRGFGTSVDAEGSENNLVRWQLPSLCAQSSAAHHQRSSSRQALPSAAGSLLRGMDVWSRQNRKAVKIPCNLLSHLQIAKCA